MPRAKFGLHVVLLLLVFTETSSFLLPTSVRFRGAFLSASNKNEPADCYGVLGIGDTATESEIKRAYRRAATKYHPDVSPGTEDKFTEVCLAYEVLKDPERRARHDRERRGSWGGASSPGSSSSSTTGRGSSSAGSTSGSSVGGSSGFWNGGYQRETYERPEDLGDRCETFYFWTSINHPFVFKNNTTALIILPFSWDSFSLFCRLSYVAGLLLQSASVPYLGTCCEESPEAGLGQPLLV